MRSVDRTLTKTLLRATRTFPCVVLTGPRRAGKTFLLTRLFPRAEYWLFEDPEVVDRFRSDPEMFLDQVHTPVILDEVQNVPEIFAHVRARIDRSPRRMGQFFLTGSQQAQLMSGVTESMAGRAMPLTLLPLSVEETSKVDVLRGGLPEVLAQPSNARLRLSAYVQTYLERDVRSISHVKDLPTFRRFMGLLAARHGQVLNKADLAAALGMSVQAVTDWLNILELTWQILVVPPYFENFGKRLTKSPKIYFADSGLACHLLGIETKGELQRSPFRGALFEGFVASELLKQRVHRGRAPQLYFFRDQQGLEVDFVLPTRNAGLLAIEAKASSGVRPEMARPLLSLLGAYRGQRAPRGSASGVVVHARGAGGARTSALAPGVRALSLEELLRELDLATTP